MKADILWIMMICWRHPPHVESYYVAQMLTLTMSLCSLLSVGIEGMHHCVYAHLLINTAGPPHQEY